MCKGRKQCVLDEILTKAKRKRLFGANEQQVLGDMGLRNTAGYLLRIQLGFANPSQ